MENAKQEAEAETSNPLLLEVCCQEGIYECSSSNKKQKTPALNYEEKIATASAVGEPSKKKDKKISNKRKCADDEVQQQEYGSLIQPSNKNKKKKMKVEKPSSVPTWVERLARTRLHYPGPAIWVCDKVITKSDTDGHLKRFFIPMTCFSENLLPALTLQEQCKLEEGIPVEGLDQAGWLWNLQLKFWSSTNVYILQKEWIKLAEKNGFKADKDTVQVWFCRCRDEKKRNERLCFLFGRKVEGGDCQSF